MLLYIMNKGEGAGGDGGKAEEGCGVERKLGLKKAGEKGDPVLAKGGEKKKLGLGLDVSGL